MKNSLRLLRRLFKQAYHSMLLRRNLFRNQVLFASLPHVSTKNTLRFAGKDIYFGFNCHIGANLTIGSKVLLASNVSFVGGDHDYSKAGIYIKDSSRQKLKTVVLEDDVWVGHGATIMHGVTIGRGAIVASGSVVTRDVPSCTIVGGNPAVFIRNRFSSEDEVVHVDFLNFFEFEG